MAKERQKLTDAQWKKLEVLLPKPRKSRKGGRPWADNRWMFVRWKRDIVVYNAFVHIACLLITLRRL